MGLQDMLPDLESIASKINFQPLDDLLVTVRQIVARIIMAITPHEPVRDGANALNGYAEQFGALKEQLTRGQATLAEAWDSPASGKYNDSLAASLRYTDKLHGHMQTSSQYLSNLSDHYMEAAFQQGILVAQAGFMAFDLGSLIFTGGTDAPLSVPAAVVDGAGSAGTVAAMDVAVDAAEATTEVIGESATELGDTAFDLADEGTDALEDGADIADDGDLMGDPEADPPADDDPLDASDNGGDDGDDPPGDDPPDDPSDEGDDGDDGNDDDDDPNDRRGPKKDRLRGRSAKNEDKNVEKVAKHLRMKKKQQYAFRRYIEDMKGSVGKGNDDNFSWDELIELGNEFLELEG